MGSCQHLLQPQEFRAALGTSLNLCSVKLDLSGGGDLGTLRGLLESLLSLLEQSLCPCPGLLVRRFWFLAFLLLLAPSPLAVATSQALSCEFCNGCALCLACSSLNKWYRHVTPTGMSSDQSLLTALH